MALTFPTILHSLYGRSLGLDVDGRVVGPPGTRHPVETLTSTLGGTIVNAGVTMLQSTAATSFTLAEPTRAGLEKTIINNSTFAHTVTRSTVASFYFSTGTAPEGVKITLSLPGSAITLISASTSKWLPKSSPGSTGWMSVSTSS